MIDSRRRVFVWIGLLLALNWTSIVLLGRRPRNGHLEYFLIGYMLGSMFANLALASSWAAFGTSRPLFRVPVSIGWILCLIATMTIYIWATQGPNEASVIYALIFLGTWLALQLPLWALKLSLRSQLKHRDEPLNVAAQQWQFGIRQLLVITTLVGVTFGIGRAALGWLPAGSTLSASGLGEFLFIAASAIVFSLPLLVAALLERRATLAILLVLLLVAIATALEWPLLQRAARGARPNIFDLTAVNGFTAFFVLVVALILRAGGYRLTRQAARSVS